MAGNFKVETSRLNSDSDTIEGLVKKIQENMGRLNDEVITLSGQWEGMAATAFMLTYRQDCERLVEIIKKREEFFADLKNARGEYNRGERSVFWEVSLI